MFPKIRVVGGGYPMTLCCTLCLLLLIALAKLLFPSQNFQSPNLRPQTPMDASTVIEFDFAPFLRLYKDGHVERLVGTDFVPAGTDPKTGVISKDITIDSNASLLARVFIPGDLGGDSGLYTKLPVFVYFHGGAFVIESAFSSTYHNYLNSVVAKARVVAVSVEYRRAPEHPLPVAYDDSFAALKWVASHANGGNGSEPWLTKFGDFERVFLAGDSAGGNIAHNILLRTNDDELGSGVKIKGMTLLNPYFWGTEPIEGETTDPRAREGYKKTWEFVCGWKKSLDCPWVDPIQAGADQLRDLLCERIRISVSEHDDFRERGKAYYRKLKESGWKGEAELFETQGEAHVYFLSRPDCEKARVELEDLVAFINRERIVERGD